MRFWLSIGMFLTGVGAAWAQERASAGGPVWAAEWDRPRGLEGLPLRLELAGPVPAEPPEEEQDAKKEKEKQVDIVAPMLQDDQLVGPYEQPAWSQHRPSPVTRIYLQVPPGDVEFEQWLEIRIPRDPNRNGNNTVIRFSEEFEFGLGSRFQLDLYALQTYQATGSNSTLVTRGWSSELRYALADWGRIWGNPTLYLEYILWNHQAGSDADPASSNIEIKVLLGDEIVPDWYWGFNISHERTLSGRQNSVYENKANLSVMHTLVDGIFSAGAAIEGVYEEDRDQDTGYSRFLQLYIGPSFQLRMAPREQTMAILENGVRKTENVVKNRAHLDFQPLVGVGPESLQWRIFLVFGWDF
jgi:hypothetical protein